MSGLPRRASSSSLPGLAAGSARCSLRRSPLREFTTRPLGRTPHPVGKQLVAPLDGTWSARRGSYRLPYRIDEGRRTVTLVDVSHRRDAYRRTT